MIVIKYRVIIFIIVIFRIVKLIIEIKRNYFFNNENYIINHISIIKSFKSVENVIEIIIYQNYFVIFKYIIFHVYIEIF